MVFFDIKIISENVFLFIIIVFVLINLGINISRSIRSIRIIWCIILIGIDILEIIFFIVF